MNFRYFRPLALCLTAACLLAVAPGCSFLPGRSKKATAADLASKPVAVGKRGVVRGLTVDLTTAPDPIKLGETREINVTMRVVNPTKKPVGLKFATTQHIEILLREIDSGKVVSQWSTDQTFLAINGYVVINPKEKVEYNKPITTRELKAGKKYNLEAYFIGYDQELRATRPIIPQP